MRTVIGPVMDVKQCQSKANPCFLELFGRVIWALDLKSGDPEFRFCSRKLNVELLGCICKYSRLVCLPSVEILNLLSLIFFFTVTLKALKGSGQLSTKVLQGVV